MTGIYGKKNLCRGKIQTRCKGRAPRGEKTLVEKKKVARMRSEGQKLNGKNKGRTASRGRGVRVSGEKIEKMGCENKRGKTLGRGGGKTIRSRGNYQETNKRLLKSESK